MTPQLVLDKWVKIPWNLAPTLFGLIRHSIHPDYTTGDRVIFGYKSETPLEEGSVILLGESEIPAILGKS